jgi:hypothetical protein
MAPTYAARKQPCPPRAHRTARTRGARCPLRAALLAPIALLVLFSCQSPDPVAKEKARTLTPDERYLVDYYMKIIDFEKLSQNNPAAAEEKRKELDDNLDRERIRRVLAELEKKPERWLAIYKRINELQYRALERQPTGQD